MRLINTRQSGTGTVTSIGEADGTGNAEPLTASRWSRNCRQDMPGRVKRTSGVRTRASRNLPTGPDLFHLWVLFSITVSSITVQGFPFTNTARVRRLLPNKKLLIDDDAEWYPSGTPRQPPWGRVLVAESAIPLRSAKLLEKWTLTRFIES